jgi:hypothetical protein
VTWRFGASVLNSSFAQLNELFQSASAGWSVVLKVVALRHYGRGRSRMVWVSAFSSGELGLLISQLHQVSA